MKTIKDSRSESEVLASYDAEGEMARICEGASKGSGLLLRFLLERKAKKHRAEVDAIQAIVCAQTEAFDRQFSRKIPRSTRKVRG